MSKRDDLPKRLHEMLRNEAEALNLDYAVVVEILRIITTETGANRQRAISELLQEAAT